MMQGGIADPAFPVRPRMARIDADGYRKSAHFRVIRGKVCGGLAGSAIPPYNKPNYFAAATAAAKALAREVTRAQFFSFSVFASISELPAAVA